MEKLKYSETEVLVQESSCCSTTDDGSAICLIPANGEKSSCACASNTISLVEIQERHVPLKSSEFPVNDIWQKLKMGLLFAFACISSPCCTPIVIPLVLWLLAGTPFALWIGQNLGWVYGGLTLLSLLSFALLWRWLKKANARN